MRGERAEKRGEEREGKQNAVFFLSIIRVYLAPTVVVLYRMWFFFFPGLLVGKRQCRGCSRLK